MPPNQIIGVERLAFRPLERSDLSQLSDWFAKEHVARWWLVSDDLQQHHFNSGYQVRRFIVLLDDRPIGMVQFYRWSDEPEAGAVIGAQPGEIGIDYLIGDASLIGIGVGPMMLNAFLRQFATGRGDITGVRVDIAEANQRSWRCLEKLGFRRDRSGISIEGQEGPHYVYVKQMRPRISEATLTRVTQLALASQAAAGMRCRILAIDGPGASGKSTLAALASAKLSRAPIIHTDDFAGWDDQFSWYQRLLDQVLVPLSQGAPARYQRYDWDRREPAEWHELGPEELLIIEGVGSSRLAFRPYLAATVWVQTRREERIRRGLARDGEAARPLWEQWMRGEDEYIARERPDQTADLVVSGEQ